MPVRLVNISPKVEVEDEKNIVFPPEVKGSIEPGSLDHLHLVSNMEWGTNMLDFIKPGTIPDCVKFLRLPPNYAHSIDDSDFSTDNSIYLHHTSIQYGSSKNSFFVWKASNEPIPVLPSNWRRTCSGWSGSITFDNIHIIKVERIPEPVVVPEPNLSVTTKSPTSLEKKRAYLEAERVYAEAKKTYAEASKADAEASCVYHRARQAYLDDKIAALDALTQTSA